MKIAVTYQDGDIFQHFGHTEFFKIYDIENTEIVKTEIVSTNGSGHGALAQFLHEHSVDTLICGGIGGGAQLALSQAGIKLYGGVTGKADDAVNALLNNKLNYDPAVNATTTNRNTAAQAIPAANTAAVIIVTTDIKRLALHDLPEQQKFSTLLTHCISSEFFLFPDRLKRKAICTTAFTQPLLFKFTRRQPYINFLLNHLPVTSYQPVFSPSQTKYIVQIPKIRLLTQMILLTTVL